MKKRRKFTAAEKITLTVLALLMIGVAVAAAIIVVNNVNDANRKATDTAHTTVRLETSRAVETTAQPGATEKVIKNKKSGTGSNASAAQETTEAAKTASNNSTSSRTSKTSKTLSTPEAQPEQDDDKIPVVTPENNSSHKSSEKCVINGTTCYVGDTINVTLNLYAPKVLVNYQGFTDFDGNYLSCTSTKSTSGGLVNAKGNQILYNASNLNGLDFTSTGTVYTAKFKVKKAGSTTITNTLEVLCDLKDVPLDKNTCKTTVAVYS